MGRLNVLACSIESKNFVNHRFDEMKFYSRNSGVGLARDSIIFYNYPLAFNPAKAKLALEEKGIKVRQFVYYIQNNFSR